MHFTYCKIHIILNLITIIVMFVVFVPVCFTAGI